MKNEPKKVYLQIGDIWLTHNPTKDTFAVSAYRGGWKRVYVYPGK